MPTIGEYHGPNTGNSFSSFSPDVADILRGTAIINGSKRLSWQITSDRLSAISPDSDTMISDLPIPACGQSQMQALRPTSS